MLLSLPPRPVDSMAAEVPSWKRALENVLPNNDNLHPRKKQRPSLSSSSDSLLSASVSDGGSSSVVSPITTAQPDPDAISRLFSFPLETSLGLIAAMEGLSDEAKTHASELRRLLYKEASASFLKSAKEGKPSKSSSKHTAVPAPIPGIKIMSTSGSESPDSVKSPGWVLPPLPPITDLSLLNAPFTHSSTLPHHIPQTGSNTYESLEFLGDAYLEVMATKLIHSRFGTHSVGQKSGLRELLIKNDTLSQYSRDYGLGQRVQILNREKISPPKWLKILADVFEAYVACVVLSDENNGLKTAEEWMWQLWEPKVKEWQLAGGAKASGMQEKLSHDVKGELQRHVVSKGVRLDYEELSAVEFDRINNRTTYHIGVYLTGWGYDKVKLGSGSGRSKQLAGAEAAKNAFATSKSILDDAHRKKLEFDRANIKRKLGQQ
jgi:ribonuclease-3